MVGLLGKYSKHDAKGLHRLIERIESCPKRPLTSTHRATPERQLNRRLSPETIAELVDAYRTGSSTNQLCQLYGLSKGGILKILNDHDVPMRYQPMTDAEIDQAVELYTGSGFSIRSVAHQLGKSKGSVWKALHERGVAMRPSTRH